MRAIQSVYIVEPDNQGWIIERLMRDVATELSARGIATRIGNGEQYGGEDVVFNSRFLTALATPRARVNSLFITHVDDRSKEKDLVASFDRFNSFVCMSPHDAEFVSALKGDASGVAGIELPAREALHRPVRLAIFSARYPDGRKNEQWLLDYFAARSPAERATFVLCFLGADWEPFGQQLAALDLSFEIYRYSRNMPGEYEMYKGILDGCDALLYMGFDGGAMSVYDALNAGVPVIASNISYHRGLDGFASLFDDAVGFTRELDRLASSEKSRHELLVRRSIAAYTGRLIEHWSIVAGCGSPGKGGPQPPPLPPDAATVDSFRAHYKPMTLGRYRSAFIRWWQSRTLRNL